MSDTYCPYPYPLRRGTLVQRYKRFLADIVLDDGTAVTAHCPNSGSMLGMKEPGSAVTVLHVPDPKRKLKWTWEHVRVGSTWVGVNTMRPNALVRWAIESGQVPGLSADAGLRTEVKYGTNSRVDLLLGVNHYVEVKNATLAQGPGAMDLPDRQVLFPDAVTSRGAKHMAELAAVVRDGGRATTVFVVNRSDVNAFAVARDIDPAYAQAFDDAVEAGVQMMALGFEVSPEGWRLRGQLPLH